MFTPEAIDLCSRKVSAVSGDIRRALMIAKRGVELASERGLTTWGKRWGVRGRMEKYVKICIDSLHSLWQELGVICP